VALGLKAENNSELKAKMDFLTYDRDGIPGYPKLLNRRWARVRPHIEPFLLGGRLAPPLEEPA
jgi:hypothetical protein